MPTNLPVLPMHVNGPCALKFARQSANGTYGSYIYLGMTGKEGVRLGVQPYLEDVDTDAAGPVPADVQHFGFVVNLSFRLVAYKNTDLAKFIEVKPGAGVGILTTPGLLLGQNNCMIKLNIASDYEGLPWTFHYCHLASSPQDLNLGTARSHWQFQLRAIPGIGGAATGDKALVYDNSAAA